MEIVAFAGGFDTMPAFAADCFGSHDVGPIYGLMNLQPVAQQSLVQSAVVVTVATLIGHLIPIVPFMVVAR